MDDLEIMDVEEKHENATKQKNCTDRSYCFSEIPKKIGLNSLNRSKAIALLIFTKFTHGLIEVRQQVHAHYRK
jgi:hypothetical protein